jgi:hypothetical protein
MSSLTWLSKLYNSYLKNIFSRFNTGSNKKFSFKNIRHFFVFSFTKKVLEKSRKTEILND